MMGRAAVEAVVLRPRPVVGRFFVAPQFPEFVKEKGSQFISAGQVEEFMKDEAKVFVMFSSFQIKGKVTLNDLSIVCELINSRQVY